MKQVNRKKEVLIWLILLLPFVYAIIIWNKVPELMPTHFNLKGEPDDYSGKAAALLVMPLINVAVYGLLFFIPLIDPRKNNYTAFGSSYQNMRLIIHLFLTGLFIYITQKTADGSPLQVNVFYSGLLLFLALLGNYFRTVRSNFFVGIRTPWTLSSDEVWRKTHALAGRLWFYSGIVLAITMLFLSRTAATVVMISGVVLMVMIPVVYSYLAYRKLSSHTKMHRS